MPSDDALLTAVSQHACAEEAADTTAVLAILVLNPAIVLVSPTSEQVFVLQLLLLYIIGLLIESHA